MMIQLILILHIRIDVSMFNGGVRDPKDYLDWEYSMDSYFNWYNMFEARRVKFANFKLAKSTKTYWKNIE